MTVYIPETDKKPGEDKDLLLAIGEKFIYIT